MRVIADEILRRLQELTPVKSGLTAASWTVIPEGIPGSFFITNSNEPVITYLTQGTAEHWVFPTVAKALHWISASGQDMFSKGHKVSGIIGVDIEGIVLTEFDPYIEAALDQAIDAADREVGFE